MTDNNATSRNKKITRNVITGVAVAAMVWGVWMYMRIVTPYTGSESVRINISRTDTPEAARDSIVAALGSSLGGKVASLWKGDVAHSHGSYVVNPGDRAWAIARNIDQRRQTPVKLTFNNVRTFNQLAERIASRMDFTSTEFIAAADSVAKSQGVSAEAFEARFLPDTYELYWSATPQETIAKITKNYARFWNEERVKKADSLGLTPMQVSIIASIAEEESNKQDERGKIGRLYINRLHHGMKLQADPTVKFATGDFGARRITADMLQNASPYNTYLNEGLPPGVIRLPEARTIDDILNATPHNYIYMCARPDLSGYHNFTTSYAEHQANARAFRRAAYGD